MIDSLRKKILNNDFNVEDIVQFAVDGDLNGIPFLNKAMDEFSWKEVGEADKLKLPPFKTWALIVISYLEDGFTGLKNYVYSDSGDYLETARFVIAILDDIKTKDSVESLIKLFINLIDNPSLSSELSNKLISAFNLLLSFSKEIELEASDELLIREFVYKYLELYGEIESNRSSAFCALRGVGDIESITKINSYAKLTGSFKGVEKVVIKAIKSRL